MRAAPDATPADWFGPRLMAWGTEEGTPVGAVVPAGYAAYARILHPAVGRDEIPERSSLAWSVVAAWSGRQLHPEVQWERLISPARPTAGPPPWSDGPVLGHLPAVVARPLVQVLRAHTDSPQRCWMCVWDGWGGWEDHAPEAPRVQLPHRSYRLMTSGIDAVVDGIAAGPGAGSTSPSLWWPEDRAWCVATEIDFCWTYVAGSQDCVDALLDHPGLEALPTQPGHRGDIDSDTINANG